MGEGCHLQANKSQDMLVALPARMHRLIEYSQRKKASGPLVDTVDILSRVGSCSE